MDELIKISAKYLILIPVLVNAYLAWHLNKDGRRRMFIVLIGGGILTVLLAALGSQLYNDPRPQYKDGSTPLFAHSDDNGFPSDHTLLASFLALTALGFNKKLGYGLLLVALLIGWARVAAHVHHAVDIAGSFALTVIAYFAVVKLTEWLLGHDRSK